jgi:hypothetical protein
MDLGKRFSNSLARPPVSPLAFTPWANACVFILKISVLSRNFIVISLLPFGHNF